MISRMTVAQSNAATSGCDKGRGLLSRPRLAAIVLGDPTRLADRA
jgi:hypothetical protein